MRLAALRRGVPNDATCIGLLSIQVFLDTYATEGVRPDLAREALGEYSPARFEQRLRDENRSFVLAEAGEGLLGFAEVRTRPSALPTQDIARSGLELVRLYVQPSAQRAGLGRRLLRESELICEGSGSGILWLTVWSENTRALAFYRALGYVDVGASTYTSQGNSYENRVMIREMGGQVLPGSTLERSGGPSWRAIPLRAGIPAGRSTRSLEGTE
jgi:ribosomal protein S18 acetylase RimI-like enzyme